MSAETGETCAWNVIKQAFPILEEKWDLPNHPPENLQEAMEILRKRNVEQKIEDMLLLKIKQQLRKHYVPTFWSFFANPHDSSASEMFGKFVQAIQYLYEIYTRLESMLERWCCARNIDNSRDVEQKLRLCIEANLLAQLPVDYQNSVYNFYECSLKMHESEPELGDLCVACSQYRLECRCCEIFVETNINLGKMGLLEPMCDQSITDLIYAFIENHICRICKDSYDISYISILEKWLKRTILSWLKQVYAYNENEDFFVKIEGKLINFLYNTYTKIRIDDLFSIIIEYPESLPALEDVKLSITRTDLKSYLIKTLQKAMKTRLLHQGVSTSDVLTAYVATIRSLRILDPSGSLMETITQPVHQYLRSREDTVRCVVTSLTEEGPNDLAEELVRGEALNVDENGDSEENNANWESWTPDPVDCASDASVHPRTSDIISMLVNVYGSKELFVNEYRTLLADRLLSQYSCDTEKEIRYLELLKLRFGDSQLHYCEVMLKDVADSKRINQHIKQHGEDNNEESCKELEEDGIPLSAMIVSAQFWPPFKEEKLELHAKLVERMESYTAAFETLKGSRTLCWKHHLGLVDMEIECGDRVLNLAVSPVHATILMHFRDFDTWSLEALSKKMHVPPTILRKKLSFWQSHGVIAETELDVFGLQDEQKHADNNANDDIIVEEYEAESAMASAQDQREEELQTFWSYILGMLMNLDTLPLERIHQMLKMFAFQGPTIECSLQELKVFLDRKVKEHQLIYSNGLYRLPN